MTVAARQGRRSDKPAVIDRRYKQASRPALFFWPGLASLAGMFADLFQLRMRRPPADYDRAFVAEVNVRRPVPRNPRLEKLILLCWGLIALKHIAVIWAVHHYAVPFHQLWINAPTFLLGLLATLVYYLHE